ncbi:MAG: DUF934 domain-containing protein [Methyloprofundus sp.]|nr:DUF934 domain-containing protein [Methyloprofundus sp.]
MPLIKNKAVTQDSWTFIADDAALNDDFNIVSLARWNQDRDALSQLKNLGLRLESDVIIEEIVADLSHFSLIELFIPVFTDGRAFTHARLLRSRYGFTGDIRVNGDFMLDQIFYLNRVGISSYVLDEKDDAEKAIAVMDDFSDFYQESVA